MTEQNNQILLETKDLQKHFPIKDFFGRKKQAVKAVDGITFQIRKGETFGLVGRVRLRKIHSGQNTDPYV